MKRACPFEFDVGRQIKIHVGQKEVNNGVFKELQMRSVYDKTMSLLKEGAKSLNLNASGDDLRLDQTNPCLQCVELNTITKFRQTFLNKNLQLETSGGETQNVAYALCGCCRIIDSQSECHRCDQILCSFCLTDCADCSETFCQNCLLQIYDHEERSLCLDCYH